MNTIYTLITYTPGEQGWHDRCGDYHSGEDSECQIHYFNDPKEAGEALGYAQFNNGSGENTLLINGLNPDDWGCILSDEDGKKLEDQFYDIDQIAFAKRQELEAESKKRIEEAKLKKQQEENLRQLQERNRQEKIEREQLAKLMSKYGTK
jgi:hypothetical protein